VVRFAKKQRSLRLFFGRSSPGLAFLRGRQPAGGSLRSSVAQITNHYYNED
jgi:hypothetical protein